MSGKKLKKLGKSKSRKVINEDDPIFSVSATSLPPRAPTAGLSMKKPTFLPVLEGVSKESCVSSAKPMSPNQKNEGNIGGALTPPLESDEVEKSQRAEIPKYTKVEDGSSGGEITSN